MCLILILFFWCRCLYSICKNMYLYVYRIPIYHDQNVPVLASHINGLPRCPMTCPPGFSLSRRRMLSPHQRVVREWPRAWCETHLAQTELLQCLLYYCGAHLAHLRYLKNMYLYVYWWQVAKLRGWTWLKASLSNLSQFVRWLILIWNALWAKVLFIESWQSTQRAGPAPHLLVIKHGCTIQSFERKLSNPSRPF